MASRGPSRATTANSKRAPVAAYVPPPPTTQPYKSGQKIKLLQPIECCGPTTAPPAADKNFLARRELPKTDVIPAGTVGSVREFVLTDPVHTEHRGDPHHHVDENRKYSYVLTFSVAKEIEYVRSFPNKTGFRVKHNTLEPLGTRKASGRYKTGEFVKTIEDVAIGGSNLIMIPAGTKLKITAKGESANGGDISNTDNAEYPVDWHIYETKSLKFVSNLVEGTKFSLL